MFDMTTPELIDYVKKQLDKKLTKEEIVKENSNEPKSIWIVKPGENTNRGNGIYLSTFSSVYNTIKMKRKHENGEPLTYIIQSYI